MIGGFIASITWAYIHEGHHQNHAPIQARSCYSNHDYCVYSDGNPTLRSTKIRRQTELFEDTLLDNFHNDIKEKYGS